MTPTGGHRWEWSGVKGAGGKLGYCGSGCCTADPNLWPDAVADSSLIQTWRCSHTDEQTWKERNNLVTVYEWEHLWLIPVTLWQFCTHLDPAAFHTESLCHVCFSLIYIFIYGIHLLPAALSITLIILIYSRFLSLPRSLQACGRLCLIHLCGLEFSSNNTNLHLFSYTQLWAENNLY